MNIEISVAFRFTIPLTLAQVDLLIALSKRHYDGVCKMASRDDGFLTIWKRLLELDDPPGSGTITCDEDRLQTCLKVLELPPLGQDPLVKRDLTTDLRGALDMAHRHYQQWKVTYKSGDPSMEDILASIRRILADDTE